MTPQLKAINGAFVTIHKQGKLKGCIGNIIGQKPLFETIRDMAIESATGDPRFEPVTKDELKDIEIEISVLSPLKKIEDMAEFQLGTHGLLVKRASIRGYFASGGVKRPAGARRSSFLIYALIRQVCPLTPGRTRKPKNISLAPWCSQKKAVINLPDEISKQVLYTPNTGTKIKPVSRLPRQAPARSKI